MKRLFTSESVTEGHPDKICDQISDGILDAILAQDKNAHVACETFCTTGTVVVMGEISTTCSVRSVRSGSCSASAGTLISEILFRASPSPEIWIRPHRLKIAAVSAIWQCLAWLI